MSGWLNYRCAMEHAVEIMRNGEEIELPADSGAWKCWKDGKTIVIFWTEPSSPLDKVDFSSAFPEGNEMWGDTVELFDDGCHYVADTVGWEINESLPMEIWHGYLNSTLTSTFSIL